MTSVKIHEFSTGIRYQTNADGSWVSLGFTGQYMNVTCESIPHCVKRSIANKEFAVAEGASSDKPAIIGRVVLGDYEEDWSVVALVSKGWDEKGRSASFYRYFLCEGGDKLPTIVTWIKSQNQLPIFNPDETKRIGQAHSFSVSPIRGNVPREFVNTYIPILIPASEQYAFEDINELATKKADSQPISWAFNVEALEQPWRFVVIQAGSDRAYQLLQKAIANPPKVRIPMVADEQALTSALKSLMGSSTVKLESLETIVEALGNTDITEDYWEELFNSQGARNALRQDIYSSQMVRLLTLRTLAIPATLREYLEWLKFDENLNKRNLNQPIVTSLQFQSQLLSLLSEFTQIYSKLTELRQGLQYYSSLATLFEKIGDYVQEKLSDHQLAIFYYQLSTYLGYPKSIIPKKLFEKAFPNQHSPQELWNRRIYKKKRKIKKRTSIMPRNIVFYLVIFTFALGVTLGGASGYFISKHHSSSSESSESLNNKSTNNNSNNSNTTDSHTNNQSMVELDISENKQQEAIQEFETISLTAINKIISETQTSFSTITEKEIIIVLKQDLGNEKLNYAAILNKNSAEYEKYRNEWIDAIYKYQQDNELGADGIISPEGKTIDLLKQKIKQRLNPPSGQ